MIDVNGGVDKENQFLFTCMHDNVGVWRVYWLQAKILIQHTQKTVLQKVLHNFNYYE